MKIEIQKIVRPIRLGDYAEEYGDAAILAWVNPPRQDRLRYWEISQEFGALVDERKALVQSVIDQAVEAGVEDAAERTMDEVGPDQETQDALAEFDRRLEDLTRRIYGWFAEMWSQSEDESTHITTDDVIELVEACQDADPAFWSWIQEQHWRLVNEHREGVKKK